MTLEQRAEAIWSRLLLEHGEDLEKRKKDPFVQEEIDAIKLALRAVVEACAEVAEDTDIGTYSALEHSLHIAQQIRREVGE